MLFPWSIHEADVALYPARKDGWPMAGPSTARGALPIVEHRASLRWECLLSDGSPAGMDYTGAALPEDGGYSLQVDFPEGLREDGLSLALSRLDPGGYYCLVVRFEHEKHDGLWTQWRFFYVTLAGDSTGDQDQIMQRSLRLRAGYRQELVGNGSLPAMLPSPLGEVEWRCGAIRVTALHYDPVSAAWTSTDQNVVSNSEEAAPFVALGETDGRGWLSYYQPRAENEDGPTLSGDPSVAGTPLTVAWRHLLALTVEPDHRVLALADFVLQTNGTPEPLLMSTQSRLWDEPVVIFRYLRRIYATIGHGTIAIPSLATELPPPTHEPDFRLGSLRMLPFGGFFPTE